MGVIKIMAKGSNEGGGLRMAASAIRLDFQQASAQMGEDG